MDLKSSIKTGFGISTGILIFLVTVFVLLPCGVCGGLSILGGALGEGARRGGKISEERRAALVQKEVSIEQLLATFDSNPLQADAAWGNALLTVDGGIVHKVDINSFSGDAYVLLKRQGDEFGLQTLRCNMKGKAGAESINVGAPLTVAGELMGKSLMSVQLNRCQVK